MIQYQIKSVAAAIVLLSSIGFTACNSKGSGKSLSIKGVDVDPEDEVYLKETKINFITNPDWEAVKAQAKKDNKGIFFYGYGKGCPGCEILKKKVFPSEEVAQYIHANFIPVIANLSISEESQNPWHIQVNKMKKEYRMGGFPQNLLLNADGGGYTRFMGVGSAPEDMIKKLEQSKDEKFQYYVQLAKLDEKNATPQALKNMLLFSKNVYDGEVTDRLMRIYLRNEKDIYTEDNLNFIGSMISSSRDTSIQILINDADKVKAVNNGYKALRRALTSRISAQYAYIAKMQMDVHEGKDKGDKVYIEQIIETFPQYRSYAEELVTFARMNVILKEQKSPEYESFALNYLDKFGKSIDHETVFECVKELLEVAKQETTMEQLNDWADYLLQKSKNINSIAAKVYVLKKLQKLDEARAVVEREKTSLTDEKQIKFLEKLVA